MAGRATLRSTLFVALRYVVFRFAARLAFRTTVNAQPDLSRQMPAFASHVHGSPSSSRGARPGGFDCARLRRPAMGASFRDRGVCACHICMYMYDERRTPWAEDAPRRPSGRFRAPALFRCALTPVFRTLRPNRDMFAAPTAVARLGFGMGRARANILVRGSPPTVQAARGIKSQALPV